jgi:hypothetical protein
MTKEILYTSALDENGNMIHIKDAEKGRTYYCPECKSKFIVRKSGKTGKGSKRPHFAHNNLTINCTPEGVLHYSFKKLLIDLLERYRSESKTLLVNWKCNACSINYSKANLLSKTATIKEEHNLKVCQPDIALLDPEGEVKAAVEIVVTHEPEENVLRYYERNGITLIQINLFSEEDLNKVEEKITNPDVVNFCLNQKCQNFRNHAAERKLIVADNRCKRYRHPMQTCHVEVNSVFGAIRTTVLTENEMRLAQSEGVRFKIREDKTTKENHLVISCMNCEIIDEKIRFNNKRIRSKYRKYGPRRF